MTIKQDIRDALETGPLTLREIATATGHPLASIENAKNYLRADGVLRQTPNQKPGAPDIKYELVRIKAAPPMISRLTTPAWVPPKPLHRPTFHAPGCVVRERLTGKVLA